jgi:DNA-binding transcriptional ArsR family regulator
MQLQNPDIIDNKSNNEDLIALLADKYSIAILSISPDKEFSGNELILGFGIPKSTVYRRLKLLEKAGLIKHVKTVINLSGNDEKYYRCLLYKATINFNDGKLSIDLDIKNDSGSKVVTIWQRLVHSEGQPKVYSDPAQQMANMQIAE